MLKKKRIFKLMSNKQIRYGPIVVRKVGHIHKPHLKKGQKARVGR